MGLFKADFYRFFALGLAGGTLLVFGVMGLGDQPALSNKLAPAAIAAESR